MKVSLSLSDHYMLYNEIKNGIGINVLTPQCLRAEEFDAGRMTAERKTELTATFTALTLQGESLLTDLEQYLSTPAEPHDFDRPSRATSYSTIQSEIATAASYLQQLRQS